MKNSFLFLVVIILISTKLNAQLKPGDEHWKQFTPIKEGRDGRFVASCTYDGFVYVCRVSRDVITTNSYRIYKISDNDLTEIIKIDLKNDESDAGEITSMTFYNNELIIAGSFKRINDNLCKGCAKWDGQKWRSLGLGIDGNVAGCVSSNNEIFFYGDFSKAGGRDAQSFAKWDGVQWSVLADIYYKQRKMEILNNYIYAIEPEKSLTRYSIAENKWEQVYPFLKPAKELPKIFGISAFLITDKGFYIAGRFGTPNTNSILKFEDNKWISLGIIRGEGAVESMIVSDNSLYIGGTFSGISNIECHNVAKFDGSKWTSLGSGISGGIKGDMIADPSVERGISYIYKDVVKGIWQINNSLIAFGNFDKAGSITSNYFASWNESVSIEKPNAKALYESAILKSDKGDYDEAINDLTMAIEQSPNDPQLYNYRGSVYITLFSIELDKQGNNLYGYRDKANADLKTAIRLNPEMASAYFHRGYLGYICEKGKFYSFETTLQDFETAIQLDPEESSFYYYLGLFYMIYNDIPEKTISCFMDAIKYSKDQNLTAYSNYQLARYYFMKNDFEKVISHIDSFLTFNSEDNWYMARRMRGLSKLNIDDQKGALIDFNEILAKYPDDKAVADLYRYRAKILFKKSGNFKDACPDMKKASELGDYDAKKFMDEVCN